MADPIERCQGCPDCLVYQLSYRPKNVMDLMIPIQRSILSSGPQETSQPSSIGRLDILPIELLHSVLKSLDFRSLSNFRRVSRGGNARVQSLPAYRDLTRHASAALFALSRARLITLHSAASIHAEFLAENCAFCQNYGPFLFLLNCERCCYHCLCSDRSLWVISRQMAGLCFGVSSSKLRLIPAMIGTPFKNPPTDDEIARRKPVIFVGLKQAEELGTTIHGSPAAMHNFTAVRNSGKLSNTQKYNVAKYTLPGFANDDGDGNFQGWACVAFPSLRRDSGLEHGLWCVGCRTASRNYSQFGVSGTPNQDERFDVSHQRTLRRLERQARSKIQFIEHVGNCQAAKDFLEKARMVFQ